MVGLYLNSVKMQHCILPVMGYTERIRSNQGTGVQCRILMGFVSDFAAHYAEDRVLL